MKIQKPENENYAAVVVSIKSITQLEGCDNVVGTPLFGFQAIVGKQTQVGDVGLFFPAETQLSEEYARFNNLFRHGSLNDDEGAKGYLEDNRRIKAMKFRGHRSDCLFMPLSSLKYIKKFDPAELKEGDVFDKIDDHEICKKYLVKVPKSHAQLQKNKLKFVRVDKKFMPDHFDTSQWWRNEHVIPDKEQVIVTQKIHGTSIRIGHTIVLHKPKLREKIAKKLGVRVQEHGYDYVFGSRRVIKDINNPNQNHFYSTDIFTEEGKKLEGMIPEGYILYGELIGWTPDGAPIQKNYTYNVPEKTCDLYIYRIATINPQGRMTDLSWKQIKEFCTDMGLKHVPELWIGKKRDFKPEDFIDKRLKDEGFSEAIQLEFKSSPDLVDEGVCIRVDGLAPYILKAKSPIFFEHETAMNDEGVVDLETQESSSE